MTPNYCDIDEDLIARIAGAFPRIKVVLQIRDPVARVWSRIAMRIRKNDLDRDKFEDASKFERFFRAVVVPGGGNPTDIFARWRKYLPHEQVGHFFLEDIAANPEEQRRRILTFLGADPSKAGAIFEADYNRKAKEEKIAMPEAARKFLIDELEDEMRESVNVFGPRAIDWLQRYNLPVTRTGSGVRAGL